MIHYIISTLIYSYCFGTNTILCDGPKAWVIFSQNSASPITEELQIYLLICLIIIILVMLYILIYLYISNNLTHLLLDLSKAISKIIIIGGLLLIVSISNNKYAVCFLVSILTYLFYILNILQKNSKNYFIKVNGFFFVLGLLYITLINTSLLDISNTGIGFFNYNLEGLDNKNLYGICIYTALCVNGFIFDIPFFFPINIFRWLFKPKSYLNKIKRILCSVPFIFVISFVFLQIYKFSGFTPITDSLFLYIVSILSRIGIYSLIFKILMFYINHFKSKRYSYIFGQSPLSFIFICFSLTISFTLLGVINDFVPENSYF